MLRTNQFYFIKFSLINIEKILANIGEEPTEEAMLSIREIASKISSELESIRLLLEDVDNEDYKPTRNVYEKYKGHYEVVMSKYNSLVPQGERIEIFPKKNNRSFCIYL